MAESPVLRHSQDVEDFNVGNAKVQHYGLLMKKPFGHKSARWQKRFVYPSATPPHSLSHPNLGPLRANERAARGEQTQAAWCWSRFVFAHGRLATRRETLIL